MARKELPAAEMLRQLLRYEPETGKLFWLPRSDDQRFSTRWGGKEAFTAMERGYKQGRIFGELHYAHRVIWRMQTGEIADDIDHINGDRGDNRWANIRHVSRAENLRNRRISRNSPTGIHGVYERAWGWQAYIGHPAGKNVCLGSFPTREEAIAARKRAEREMGYHENHGRA